MRSRIAQAAALLALLPFLHAQAQTAPSADPQVARGQRLFLRCVACHDIAESKLVKIGPNLKGVVGRPVASVPGFAYSAALKKLTFTWDEARLSEWLTRPGVVAPGTSMAFEGMPLEADRKALIAYLAAQR
jgi:cytochrome c